MKQETDSPWAGRSRASDHSFEERRMVVLAAAARMFWRKGFHETSFDALAEALNITKPTVYYYVHSKAECLADISRIGQERVIASIHRARKSRGPCYGKLMIVFRGYIAAITDDFGKCLVLVGNRALTGERKVELQARVSWADRAMRELFQQGIDDGSVDGTDPHVLYQATVGSVNWIAHWYDPEGRISPQELMDNHLSVISKMLLPRERTAQP
jgi:AcrR family transcriptional regulator